MFVDLKNVYGFNGFINVQSEIYLVQKQPIVLRYDYIFSSTREHFLTNEGLVGIVRAVFNL